MKLTIETVLVVIALLTTVALPACRSGGGAPGAAAQPLQEERKIIEEAKVDPADWLDYLDSQRAVDADEASMEETEI